MAGDERRVASDETWRLLSTPPEPHRRTQMKPPKRPQELPGDVKGRREHSDGQIGKSKSQLGAQGEAARGHQEHVGSLQGRSGNPKRKTKQAQNHPKRVRGETRVAKRAPAAPEGVLRTAARGDVSRVGLVFALRARRHQNASPDERGW